MYFRGRIQGMFKGTGRKEKIRDSKTGFVSSTVTLSRTDFTVPEKTYQVASIELCQQESAFCLTNP